MEVYFNILKLIHSNWIFVSLVACNIYRAFYNLQLNSFFVIKMLFGLAQQNLILARSNLRKGKPFI